MLEDEPPAAKGPPDGTPLSLFKKMQLKYAKNAHGKGKRKFKKMEKWKGVFL